MTYTNHRGETAERTARPVKLYHGATEWHPEPQWLLHAWDDDKQAFRDFALAGINPWET
jgi:predicted DNA-binding transcriptional regulator YafY